MKRLGLLGDPHACPEPVAEALSIFKQQRVDAIWCTGDIAGYGEALAETIHLLQQADCQSILGNHEIWYLEKQADQGSAEIKQYLNELPLVIHQDMEGKRVYMVHASPPDSMSDGIRLLDQHGNIIEAEKQSWSERLAHFDYEVLIVGHTHQAFAEVLGTTLVINPGSTRFNHSCAILQLPDLKLQWFALSGQPIRRSWNWGMGLPVREGTREDKRE